MNEITLQIQSQLAKTVNPNTLKQAAQTTLQTHSLATEPLALSIVVTGEGASRRLNREYRGIDAPTDVLAFATGPQPAFMPPSDEPRYLGDVIICAPQAAAQAKTAGHSLEAELQLLVVHGVLHLLGHDDAQPDARQRMWAAQEKVLAALGVALNLPPLEAE